MTESTPRIAPLPRSEWTDQARDVFAYWEGDAARENGSRSNTMMTLANHPPLALASLDLGRYFMTQAKISPRQLKIIVLRVAHRYGSTYQWTHNALGAQQLGMTAAEVERIKAGPDAEGWSAQDSDLLRLIDEVGNGGRVSEETWAAISQHMDREQIMDTIHAIGYFTMVAWGLITMGVQVEPDFADFSRNRAKTD